MGTTGILILFGTVVLIGLIMIVLFIGIYSKLVNFREIVKNSKEQIEIQVESRWDALINLIQAAKQYASYESETLESAVTQRSSLSSNMSPEDLNESEEMFQNSLSRLIAITENYPDLKSNEVYQQAMSFVDKYEKNVQLSRMSYNDTVAKYNRIIITIPTSIIASLMKFDAEPYF